MIKALETVVKIVQMDRHFLYLPLYLASHRGWYGLLPNSYSVRIESSRNRTDQSAFDQMMETKAAKDSDVFFAVCDPSFVVNWQSAGEAAPAILGGLITNAAFWAIDKNTHELKKLTDLSNFERVIAFKEGSTSYGIARRACGNALDKIYTVDPSHELAALRDSHAVSSVALTPDLLGVVQLVSGEANQRASQPFHIDMAIGLLEEYANVIITALISRTDVIESHPELVSGIVGALQLALIEVRTNSSGVCEFAADYFPGSNENSREIKEALGHAIDYHVFPASIEVIPAQWQRAVAVAMNKRNRSRGIVTFDAFVKPHLELVRKSIQMPGSIDLTGDTEKASWRFGVALAICTLIAVSWILPVGFETSLILTLAGLVAFLVPGRIGYPILSKKMLGHGVLVTVMAVFAELLINQQRWHTGGPAILGLLTSALVTAFGGYVTLLFKLASQSRRTNRE